MRTEIRVYVLKPNVIQNMEENPVEITDEEFHRLAEINGTVYSEEGFTDAFNDGEIASEEDFIRIIDVEVDTPKREEEEPVSMKEIYRIMHKRMKNAKSDEIRTEVFDILQEIKFPEDYK